MLKCLPFLLRFCFFYARFTLEVNSVQFRYKDSKVKKECTDKKTATQKHSLLFKKIQETLRFIDIYPNMEELNKQIGYVQVHPLKGDREGQWALTLFSQYRLIFLPLDENGKYSNIREHRNISHIEIIEVSKHYG
jgi:proteic killer suppression protein